MPEDDDDLEGVLDDNIRRELRDARKQREQLAEQQQMNENELVVLGLKYLHQRGGNARQNSM